MTDSTEALMYLGARKLVRQANELKRERRMTNEELKRDAARYWRLRVLGCAPCETKQLDNGTVLRFSNLDEFIDHDIKIRSSRGEAEIYENKTEGAAVSASPQPEKWPQHCDFCNQDMESADDRTEWHGLGNCVPVCMVCMGSGIEPSKVDCPDCCGKGKTPTASAQVPWKLCPMCKATGKISSKPFAAAPAQEPRQVRNLDEIDESHIAAQEQPVEYHPKTATRMRDGKTVEIQNDPDVIHPKHPGPDCGEKDYPRPPKKA